MTEPNRAPQYDAGLREQARVLYLRYGTYQAVAEEMGISRARAAILVKESGLQPNPPGRPRRDR